MFPLVLKFRVTTVQCQYGRVVKAMVLSTIELRLARVRPPVLAIILYVRKLFPKSIPVPLCAVGRTPRDMAMEVYYASTPNGWKVSIMAEELKEEGSTLPIRFVYTNIYKGDQLTPEFTRMSPNARMPALCDKSVVDRDGLPFGLFESGAILMYLAEKSGSKLLPTCPLKRYKCIAWLFWQVGGLGPMAGQLSHFVNYAPFIDSSSDHGYSLGRYRKEYDRLFGVMDRQLSETSYLAGDEYTIADIAAFPWVIGYKILADKHAMDSYPNLRRWFVAVKSRPAVRRGMDYFADRRPVPQQGRTMNAKAKSMMFNQTGANPKL